MEMVRVNKIAELPKEVNEVVFKHINFMDKLLFCCGNNYVIYQDEDTADMVESINGLLEYVLEEIINDEEYNYRIANNEDTTYLDEDAAVIENYIKE